MTDTFGFTPGQPPEWDLERFLRGDEIATAVITLERNRRTFAWKCFDVDARGLRLRLGASAVTLGGLLKHMAWVEELYFQNRLAGRPSMPPFDEVDPERDWEDWAWRTAPTTRRTTCARSSPRPCTAHARRWARRWHAAGWSRRPTTA
jgi:hypothetical protein